MIIKARVLEFFKPEGEDVKYSDLPSDLLPDDFIRINYVQSSNRPEYGYVWVEIYREREETEDEKNQRELSVKAAQDLARKNRYDYYLKLKEEFENDRTS